MRCRFAGSAASASPAALSHPLERIRLFRLPTALNRYGGLQVTYQALLVQQALDVSGSGEQLSDRSPTQDAVDNTGNRAPESPARFW